MKDKEKQINRTDNFEELSDTVSIPNKEKTISVSKFENIKLTIPCKKETEEKQIEFETKKEIAKELDKVYPNAKLTNGWIAEVFYRLGYRKLPENARVFIPDGQMVLLSREEWEKELWKMYDKGFECAKMFIEKEKQQTRKETAKDILSMFDDKNYITENDLKNAIAKRYGVKL